ncbi:V-set and immunoglobulin domain-containing protein 10-like isoform X2 [Hyperolius riggenbachi]|uniref:V-set and immunoglobulin domain-containing protein 10-like isoform X2 n=2 Tax=Hyperolius riggenbachi TaxID=752182 RepID=UPI0035A29FF9
MDCPCFWFCVFLLLHNNGSPTSSSISCKVEPFTDFARFICSWPGLWPVASIDLIFNGTVKGGQDIVTKTVMPDNEVQQPELTCRGDQSGKKSECHITFELPKSTSHNNTMVTSLSAGEDATLTVNLMPNILHPQFSWFLVNPDPVPFDTANGRLYVTSRGSQSTLHISSVVSSDNGSYECRSRNIIGSSSFMFNLQVTPSAASGDLNGGEIFGIVIGVLSGVIIITTIATLFILRRRKQPPEAPVYVISDVITSNIYEKTLPSMQMGKPGVQPEPIYESLSHEDKSVYSTLASDKVGIKKLLSPVKATRSTPIVVLEFWITKKTL